MTDSKLEPLVGLKKKAIAYLSTNRPLILLFILCFTVSLIFSLNEFPTGSDIPSHYIKIVNMRNMLEEGKFIRWSYDWYAGYAMFDIYPPLIYVFVATLDLLVDNIALLMKLVTVVSFSASPLLLYRLGRVLGRSSKGATAIALLFELNPLNMFFLFNGYFVFILSLALTFLFLTEFFKYSRKREKRSFLYSVAILATISLTYHRSLYFILFTIFFHFLLKVYRRQFREAASAALMTITGVGISSFWLLPAAMDMLSLQSVELYQSLILGASHQGVSFQAISILFIIPYVYLAFERIRKKKIEGDSELVLLFSLIFFTILALGPYGPFHYVVPFSSSQRVEVAILIASFYATVLASSLFDERIKECRRTFSGILVSGLFFLAFIVSIFFYPRIAMSLDVVNFTYSREEIDDSLTNLISNAYVKEQVFLGKNDQSFLQVLRYISNDSREGRVAFYSNRSQTVDMFYYYALLPLSGKSTPQGVVPEGEGDLKWGIFTKDIIWHANETLLRLAGTRWVISNYPLALESNSTLRVFGQYMLYELDEVNIVRGCEGWINEDIGEIWITLAQRCRSITIAESYHPRWRAFDQDGREIGVESTEFGFIKVTSTNDLEEVRLVYSDTATDLLGRTISILCLALFAGLSLITRYSSSQTLSRIKIW